MPYFNPRAPCGARPVPVEAAPSEPVISIHAPRAGRDEVEVESSNESLYFNPRAPCGARPRRVSSVSSDWIFQSTRPVRGATYSARRSQRTSQISIHAPRAGRDNRLTKKIDALNISIHAPRAGRDDLAGRERPVAVHISIHAPRAGRDDLLLGVGLGGIISIHAPRAGRDLDRL